MLFLLRGSFLVFARGTTHELRFHAEEFAVASLYMVEHLCASLDFTRSQAEGENVLPHLHIYARFIRILITVDINLHARSM